MQILNFHEQGHVAKKNFPAWLPPSNITSVWYKSICLVLPLYALKQEVAATTSAPLAQHLDTCGVEPAI